MVVGQADGKMRFWRNTRVATLAASATTTIGTNVDRLRVGRGPRQRLPARRARSGCPQTAGTGDRIAGLRQQLRAGHGHPLDDDCTGHASGALVFGAGTIQWAWALDSNHDRGSAAADTRRAAGDRQPARRHGRAARHAAARPGRGDRVHRHHRADRRRSPRRPAGATLPVGTPVTVTGTAADTGGGRVGGVEVSTDNGATWRRATGRETWTYTFTPSAAGAAHPAGPGRRRQRQHRDAAATGVNDHRRDRARPPARARSGRAPPRRPAPTRTPSPVELGREVPRQRGRLHHRDPLLQAAPQTTGTHVGSPVDQHRHPARPGRPSPTSRASGWQQATFATPVAVTANTTYVASYFTPTRYSVSSALLRDRGDHARPADRARERHRRRQRRLPLQRHAPAPSPTSTCNSENYWVDVVFTEATDTTKPTVTARTPAPGATGVAARRAT